MRAQSFLALTCSLFAASLFAGETLRFSQSLTSEQRTAAGIDRLNSDQVAALDALVRLDARKAAASAKQNDTPAQVAGTATADNSPAAFSQSLSADQRRAAGLDSLTSEQQNSVDTLVEQRMTAETTRHDLATTTTVEAVEFFPNRYEVHGQVGLSIGGGSGGYSSREAWMTTSLLDTKTGTEFSVSVATGREKWKGPYRYHGYRNDWDDVGFGLSAPLFRSR